MSEPIWKEPVRGGPFPSWLLGLSGVDQLRLLLNGRAVPPPISFLTGMHPTEVGVGSATFTMQISGWLQTPQGIATAGEVAILADGPLGCAIQTVLPAATGYTTTELSINMARPVPKSGRLIARGRLVHGGRQLGLSEVFVVDDAGRLIAHGTSRCVIFPPAEDAPRPPSEMPPASVEEGGWTPPFERPVRGTVLDQEIWDARTGLEVLRSLIAGELPTPPVTHLLGAAPIEASEGRCVFSMPASDWLTSPTGFVEGGVTACLADFALGGATQTTMPAGAAFAPTDLRVQFIRPVPPKSAPITARANVVHRGRGVAVTRAEVTNDEGKLVALASGSAVILSGRRADLEDVPAPG